MAKEWRSTFFLILLVGSLCFIMLTYSNCSPFDKGNASAQAGDQNAADNPENNPGNGGNDDEDDESEDGDSLDEDNDDDDSSGKGKGNGKKKNEKDKRQNSQNSMQSTKAGFCIENPSSCSYVCVNGQTYFVENSDAEEAVSEGAGDQACQ